MGKRKGRTSKTRRFRPSNAQRLNPYINPFRTGMRKVFKFKQTVAGSHIGIGTLGAVDNRQQTGANQYGTYAFRLVDLPQCGNFQALFDQYRITKVKVDFIPMVTQTTTGVVAGIPGVPVTSQTMGTVIDYDDATALTSYDAYTEYDNFKFQGNYSMKTHSRTFKPHLAGNIYAGGFGGYSNLSPKTWIDCATANAEYYGLKWVIEAGTTAEAQFYRIMATYWVEFRNVR